MILDKDAEFHEPKAGEPLWGETNYFGFEIPEVPLHIGLYSLFRPNLGVVNSAIFVNSRRVTSGWEIDYWDHRAYLPLKGQPLTDFELDNGLKVVSVKANQLWDISFHKDNVPLEIDVRFEALMQPLDIHDPDMDPRAHREGSDLSAGSLWAGGHFDLTGAVTGTVTLRGVTYRVDWMSTMDHSWGVRGEYQPGTMTWLQAHFSRDLAVHAMFQFDPKTPVDRPLELSLTHGYLMRNGKAMGFKDGTGRTERSGLYQVKTTLDLIDVDDRVWHLDGESLTQFPAEYWSGSMSMMVMKRWSMNGETGYGTSTDFYDYYHFTELYPT
jgi:hypothetical protein